MIIRFRFILSYQHEIDTKQQQKYTLIHDIQTTRYSRGYKAQQELGQKKEEEERRIKLRRGSDGDATVRDIRDSTRDHGDAINDRANTSTEGTTSAIISDSGNVSVGIETDGLVSTVVASHVALTTVDAHLVIHKGNHLHNNNEYKTKKR